MYRDGATVLTVTPIFYQHVYFIDSLIILLFIYSVAKIYTYIVFKLHVCVVGATDMTAAMLTTISEMLR